MYKNAKTKNTRTSDEKETNAGQQPRTCTVGSDAEGVTNYLVKSAACFITFWLYTGVRGKSFLQGVTRQSCGTLTGLNSSDVWPGEGHSCRCVFLVRRCRSDGRKNDHVMSCKYKHILARRP